MIKEIDYKQMLKMLEAGADLVDVREPDEYNDGKIGGSKEWPLSTFGLRQKDIAGGRPTIFYCRSGLRSMKAAEIAEQWTEQPLYSLQGGLIELQATHPESESESEKAS